MRVHFEKRANGWLARAHLPRDPATGKKRRISAFGLRQRDALRALEAKLLAAPAQHSGSACRTFGELVDHWFAAANLSETSRASEGYRLRALSVGLRAVRLADFDPAHLEKLYGDLVRRGLAPSTVRRLHQTLRSAGKTGERLGWWPENKVARAHPPTGGGSEIRPPDATALAAALDAIQRERADYGALFRVLAVVGLRRGEALGLRWSDVDFADETITVRRSVGAGEKGRPVVTDGKTAASRATVPVDSETLGLLRSLRRAQRESLLAAGVPVPADGYVWRSDPLGVQPLTPGAVSLWWRRNREGLGLPGVRVHDLRHFVATQLIAAGVDIVTVQARLRHSRGTTTLAFYGHPVQKREREAADIAARVLRS